MVYVWFYAYKSSTPNKTLEFEVEFLKVSITDAGHSSIDSSNFGWKLYVFWSRIAWIVMNPIVIIPTNNPQMAPYIYYRTKGLKTR